MGLLNSALSAATKYAPLIAAANPYVAAGVSLLGSMHSAKQSQRSADKQMAFQASQTGTGYQRAMADMKRAGLNPMLAAKLGPAASGSGAMANIPDYGQAIQRGASAAQSAASIGKIDQEIKNLGLDEVAKGLDNQSKALLVKFEKSLSDEAYKLYKMPILKFLAEALDAPGVVVELANSELVSGAKRLGQALVNPVKTMDNVFRYVSDKGKEFAQEYGQDAVRSLRRAVEDIYADFMTRK
jgi:hypothetical protein